MCSWLASTTVKLNKRERTVITCAGIIPDIDGFGLIVDFVAKNFGYTTHYWFQFHHQLHTLPFCLLISGISAYVAKTKKLMVAVMACFVFHLHLFCDLIGARGPDGYQWPMPYFSPFSDDIQLKWSNQWELNAWPNILIGIGLMVTVILVARKKQISPFEIVSPQMNNAFLKMVKN
jgi:hypothetical protein